MSSFEQELSGLDSLQKFHGKCLNWLESPEEPASFSGPPGQELCTVALGWPELRAFEVIDCGLKLEEANSIQTAGNSPLRWSIRHANAPAA